jgi:hypothetical protein
MERGHAVGSTCHRKSTRAFEEIKAEELKEHSGFEGDAPRLQLAGR